MNGDNSTQQLHESSSGLGGSTSNNPRDAFNQRGSGSEPNPRCDFAKTMPGFESSVYNRWKNEPTPISVPANVRLVSVNSRIVHSYIDFHGSATTETYVQIL